MMDVFEDVHAPLTALVVEPLKVVENPSQKEEVPLTIGLLFIVMSMLVVVAHSPISGVNVYVFDNELLMEGDQHQT